MASYRPSLSPRRAPARLVRELGPFALLLCACGAAVREPAAASGALPVPAEGGERGANAVLASTPGAFDALSARASSLAPGMREVARREGGTGAVDLAKAEGRDACVRVAFESSAPITVKLVDQGGNVLTATDGQATDGVLAAHGPVCVRKGDVVRGLAEGTGARVRWMAWQAQ
jgi:hypothetical protein